MGAVEDQLVVGAAAAAEGSVHRLAQGMADDRLGTYWAINKVAINLTRLK